MIPVLDARRMRAADAETIRAGVASGELMERAADSLCRELLHAHPGWTRVAVVCGPGNNGGDGLAAARMLASRGLLVSLLTLPDPSFYTGDPAANLGRARSVGLSPCSLTAAGGFAALKRALAESDGVVDALFGTGLTRPLQGAARRAVEAINASGRPVVSADLPSGLSADGGDLLGTTVRAERTVCFGAPKLCHVLPPASGFCGRIAVADIGIPRRTLEKKSSRLWLVESSDARALLPPRPPESNKGDFGRLAVIAGSRGKTGAAILAARGALRAGAGLVTVFCAESLAPLIVAALPEAMTFGLVESRGTIAKAAAVDLLKALSGFDAAVVGPGLGTSAETVAFLEQFLSRVRLPVVADADALNAFAGRPRFFARRAAPTILTPHPGEAGRLLGRTPKEIQGGRLEAVRAIARAGRSVTLLKGARTLVASPAGDVVVNPTGTPLLATAGAGDVLTGVIGALLAGGLAPREAAMAGAYLHGAAAESLEPRLGDAGLLASEAADAVPGVRAALRTVPPADG